jgi:hypothetical protein
MPALLSYGAHFPLVVYVARERRRKGGPLLVLNGDRWPGGGWSSTPNHQAIVRRLADESGLEWVLIPFSALEGAGVDISTIEVRERRPDETIESFEPAPSGRIEDAVRDTLAGRYGWTMDPYDAHRPALERNLYGGTKFTCDDHEWSVTVHKRWREHDPDGLTQWYMRLVGEGTDHPREPQVTVYRDGSHQARKAGGEWHTVIKTHRLGECLFSAETVHEPTGSVTTPRVRRRAVFVSSFDYNERPPLYFLAEVPRAAGARTVAQAIEALAPRVVHAAIAQGRQVYRQGDVFCIETDLSDAALAARTVDRARLTQWMRGARARQGETGYVAPLTAAERRRWDRRTVKRYHELRASQWAKALETRPEGKRTGYGWVAVRSARMNDRDRYRVYFGSNAKAALERARQETMPARMRPVDRETIRTAVSIYGTAHSATEVVTARGGATYCRGVLRQVPDLDPSRRDANRDHVHVPLGDGSKWFLAVRNTVPARVSGRAVGGPLQGRIW